MASHWTERTGGAAELVGQLGCAVVAAALFTGNPLRWYLAVLLVVLLVTWAALRWEGRRAARRAARRR